MKRTKNPAKEAEYRKRATDLVAQMTLHEKVSQMLSWAPAIERLGIPAYNWWSEGIHGIGRAGTATVFPQAIGMAAAFDEDMMEQVGATPLALRLAASTICAAPTATATSLRV